jgi:hypothetical protein
MVSKYKHGSIIEYIRNTQDTVLLDLKDIRRSQANYESDDMDQILTITVPNHALTQALN